MELSSLSGQRQEVTRTFDETILQLEPRLRVSLLTGLDSCFVARLISNLKRIEEITFADVIYWKRRRSKLESIRGNIRKHGIAYLFWRPLRLLDDAVIKKLASLVDGLIYAPKVDDDMFSACSRLGMAIHTIDDIHSEAGLSLVRSLNLDLLLVCGTGILRKSIFGLPHIGTINLHQGEAPRYRGAPPGFWELWNNERRAGVTIHFVDEGVDTGDIVLQKTVPIFGYDTLRTLQAKLTEISLSVYPLAVKRIARNEYNRAAQSHSGRQYYFPTLLEIVKLYVKVRRRQFRVLQLLRGWLKNALYAVALIGMCLRDALLRLQGKGRLCVLYYHRVTDVCRDGMTVSMEDFEKQIRFLRKHYSVLSSRDLLESLGDGGNIRGINNCLITFDDGYQDNYANALPILRKYGCPAIFLVSTGFVNSSKQFAHDTQLHPGLKFENMTWEQLRESGNSNITIGIHSHSHANLGRIDLLEAVKEIETSIQTFQSCLKSEPLFMSYPFGMKLDMTEEIRAYIKEHTGLKALFSAYGGLNPSPIDRHDIKRINVGSGDSGLAFAIKLKGGFRPFKTSVS